MKYNSLKHQFVEYIPDEIRDGIIYISISFRTVMHRCCCGCGYEVVTPLSPTDWKLTFDGETITLYPSIGNWSLPCQSHYWIDRNRIRWAPQWSTAEIATGRAFDAYTKGRYYNADRSLESDSASTYERRNNARPKVECWRRLKNWFLGK